jgi:hypothetical protein
MLYRISSLKSVPADIFIGESIACNISFSFSYFLVFDAILVFRGEWGSEISKETTET